jgi:hypothetical protein
VAGAAAGGVTSFLLITLRFAVVFLAFLEDFFTFFFAICLLDDTARYMPSKRHVGRKKGEERKRSWQRHQHYPCTPSLWHETRKSSCDMATLSPPGERIVARLLLPPKSIPAIALLPMPLLHLLSHLLFLSSPRRQAGTDSTR